VRHGIGDGGHERKCASRDAMATPLSTLRDQNISVVRGSVLRLLKRLNLTDEQRARLLDFLSVWLNLTE
jgi:hypothetical protein